MSEEINEVDSTTKMKKLLFAAVQFQVNVTHAEAAHHAVRAFEVASLALDELAKKANRFEQRASMEERSLRQRRLKWDRATRTTRQSTFAFRDAATNSSVQAMAHSRLRSRPWRTPRGVQLALW